MKDYLDTVLNAKLEFQNECGIQDHLLKVMIHPSDYIKMERESQPYDTPDIAQHTRPLFGMKVEVREELQKGKFIITEKGWRER